MSHAAHSASIAHLITGLPRGGAENNLANLLAALQKQYSGNQHTVIYFNDGPVRQTIEKLGIRCIRVHAWGGYANPLFFIRLLRVIKALRPTVIQADLWAATFFGTLCAKMLGLPIVSIMHNNLSHTGKIRRLIDALNPCKPTHTVAVSASVAESLLQAGYRPAGRMNVIENGIDPAAVVASAQVEHGLAQAALAHIPQGSFIVGAVGRLVPVKNYPLLLQGFAYACKRQPNLHLVIVGSGPEEAAIKQLVQTLGLQKSVTFTGNVPARCYYQFFGCYAQPSFSEGLSIALLEALSNGVPALVASADGTHDVIISQGPAATGMVLPPDDYKLWGQKIIELSRNTTLRATLGQAGQLLVQEKFSIGKTAQAYQELYRNLVAR